MYTRYYTLFLVRDGKFHFKSRTGNAPPPLLWDKVPLFPLFLYGSPQGCLDKLITITRPIQSGLTEMHLKYVMDLQWIYFYNLRIEILVLRVSPHQSIGLLVSFISKPYLTIILLPANLDADSSVNQFQTLIEN